MGFEVIDWARVSRERFVEFWASQYHDPREALYERCIGRPYAVEEVLDLFRWKNGGKLSARKQESVFKNYVDRLEEFESLPLETSPSEFLQKWSSGGAIWRIFWLHCWRPDRYPIYDQHVHRAAARIESWPAGELPGAPGKQVAAYLQQYLPFCEKHGFTTRADDRALWAYGKFLKSFTALTT